MISQVTVPTPGLFLANAARDALPSLTTPRLHLRPPQLEDFAIYQRLFLLPSARHMGAEPDVASLWADFTNYVAGWLLRGDGMFAVTLEGETIGFVFAGVETGDEAIELGFFIAPEHQRKGYAYEAALAGLIHLQSIGATEIVSYVSPDNEASKALVAKLGGIQTGTLDGALVFTYPADIDGTPEAYA